MRRLRILFGNVRSRLSAAAPRRNLCSCCCRSPPPLGGCFLVLPEKHRSAFRSSGTQRAPLSDGARRLQVVPHSAPICSVGKFPPCSVGSCHVRRSRAGFSDQRTPYHAGRHHPTVCAPIGRSPPCPAGSCQSAGPHHARSVPAMLGSPRPAWPQSEPALDDACFTLRAFFFLPFLLDSLLLLLLRRLLCFPAFRSVESALAL